MIKREKIRKTDLGDLLVAFCQEALYHRIRRQEKGVGEIPGFASTYKMAEYLVFPLLRLYEKVLPGLNAEGVPPGEAMWVLVENLFLPTVYVQLCRNWRSGLEFEFKGAQSWYLPTNSGGKRLNPIPRALQYWLRAAGLHSGYSVYKSTARDSWKRKVDRWLKEEKVPTMNNLHELLEEFAQETGWAGDLEAWKARFTLACGMQKLCMKMDVFLKEVRPESSLDLAKGLKDIEMERIVHDDDGLLADTDTFFAARLLYHRLKRDGKWESQVMARVPNKPLAKGLPTTISDEQIAQVRAEIEWQCNPGNWFLQVIQDDIAPKRAAEFVGNPRDQILSLGIDELNQILASKRAGGQFARQP